MASKKQPDPPPERRTYVVALTGPATIETTYHVEAESAAAAVAMARSGDYPADSEEVTDQQDVYCTVDGEEYDL